MIDYIIVILIAFILLSFLLIINFSFRENSKNSKRKYPGQLNPVKKKGSLLVCPICFHRTSNGEKVYAKSLKLPNGKIRIEVSGCDHCIGKLRKCPRCQKELGKNDVVFGLLFKNKTENNQCLNKDRLHIEGCMGCYRR